MQLQKNQKELGLKRLLLICTKFTMNNNLEMKIIHETIFPEIVVPKKKNRLIDICNNIIVANNIDGLTLGCTEHTLMIKKSNFNIEVLDTAEIQINKIIE